MAHYARCGERIVLLQAVAGVLVYNIIYKEGIVLECGHIMNKLLGMILQSCPGAAS